MSVLIGCSPSTGSSLLRRILNRHPELFCGSETSLFAKQALYTDWSNAKSRLTRSSVFGMSNAGWHDFVGLSLDETYGWTKPELRHLIKQSTLSFPVFASKFYEPILEREQKSIWVEKTPSNAFTLELFLDNFPEGKVVHIVRNPLDAIASLYKRGMDLYNAVNVYLLNTAKALELLDHPRSFTIKYELLVNEPELNLKALCDFLDITYVETMLEPQKKEGGIIKMEGWKQEETALITTKSVGRYLELSTEEQHEVLARIALTEIDLGLSHRSIKEIALTLGYDLPPAIVFSNDLPTILKKERKEDIWKRHLSIAHFRKPNYPIKFIDVLA